MLSSPSSSFVSRDRHYDCLAEDADLLASTSTSLGHLKPGLKAREGPYGGSHRVTCQNGDERCVVGRNVGTEDSRYEHPACR